MGAAGWHQFGHYGRAEVQDSRNWIPYPEDTQEVSDCRAYNNEWQARIYEESIEDNPTFGSFQTWVEFEAGLAEGTEVFTISQLEPAEVFALRRSVDVDDPWEMRQLDRRRFSPSSNWSRASSTGRRGCRVFHRRTREYFSGAAPSCGRYDMNFGYLPQIASVCGGTIPEGEMERHELRVTLKKPEWIVHEGLFVQDTDETEFYTHGVVEPAAFGGANGETVVIEGITWVSRGDGAGGVSVAVSSTTGIAGYQ